MLEVPVTRPKRLRTKAVPQAPTPFGRRSSELLLGRPERPGCDLSLTAFYEGQVGPQAERVFGKHRITGRHSLIRPEFFPAPPEKFPVLVFREMAPYQLIYMRKRRV